MQFVRAKLVPFGATSCVQRLLACKLHEQKLPLALQTPCDASLSVQGDILPHCGGPAKQGARSGGSKPRALSRLARRSPLLEGDVLFLTFNPFSCTWRVQEGSCLLDFIFDKNMSGVDDGTMQTQSEEHFEQPLSAYIGMLGLSCSNSAKTA